LLGLKYGRPVAKVYVSPTKVVIGCIHLFATIENVCGVENGGDVSVG
jgi:hypothetical protein